MIHGYASLSHYGDHIAPVIDALPDELRGEMWSPSERKPWGLLYRTAPHGGVWIVAGYADAVRLRTRGPLVYVEHGAGQTYPGDPRSAGHGAFSGGDGLDHVGLFICPSETVADRWRHRYPNARAVAVGCPKLDPWLRGRRTRMTPYGPVVAWTFHHENAQIPEQASTRTYYRDAIAHVRDAVADMGGILIGHAHPRNWVRVRDLWRSHDVPCTDDLGEVFDRADLLLVDNSSAGYEFAALGHPIVWLSAPWYRRDVDHGQRFWRDVEGIPHVEHPSGLVDAIRVALSDPPEIRAAREAMADRVYAYRDGHAADRAAAAIMEFTADLG